MIQIAIDRLIETWGTRIDYSQCMVVMGTIRLFVNTFLKSKMFFVIQLSNNV